MSRIHLKKTFNALIPADQEAEELLKKLDSNEVLYIEVKRARNYNFHKKMFALLKIGLDNTKLENQTEESYREYILMKSGHYYTNSYPNYTQFRAKSISYEKLNQNVFDELYPIVRQTVANDIGATNEEIEKQILEQF